MTSALIALGVLLLIVVVLGLWVAGIYNRLVEFRNRFKNAFAQIDVQLKRRYDLIPNLVEIAKGYLKHERETLEAVIKARNIAAAAAQTAAANPASGSSMKSLISAEIGNQKLDYYLRTDFAYRQNSLHKMFCAAVREVVPCDRGYDSITEFKKPDSPCDVLRFHRIGRKRHSRIDSAESAFAGAYFSENQKSSFPA